jgi:hypothetical protein
MVEHWRLVRENIRRSLPVRLAAEVDIGFRFHSPTMTGTRSPNLVKIGGVVTDVGEVAVEGVTCSPGVLHQGQVVSTVIRWNSGWSK